MSQAIEMSRALKAQGVATELHIAPNEGHDWAQPAHQLYKMNVEMEWFERYTRVCLTHWRLFRRKMTRRRSAR